MSMREQVSEQIKRMVQKCGMDSESDKVKDIIKNAEEMYDRNIVNDMTALEAYKSVMMNLDGFKVLKIEESNSDDGDKANGCKTAVKESPDRFEGVLNSVLWLFSILFYFFISITFGYWHLTWLIFLSSSIGSVIIKILCDMNRGIDIHDMTDRFIGIMWLALTIIYFLLSFITGAWHLTWLIFIVGALISVLINFIKSS